MSFLLLLLFPPDPVKKLKQQRHAIAGPLLFLLQYDIAITPLQSIQNE